MFFVRVSQGIIIVLTIGLLTTVFPAGSVVPDDESLDTPTDDCIPHPPIRISSDAMFKLGPAVGVVNPSAAGTAEDPYLIEGWCITPQVPKRIGSVWLQGAGILLEDTSSHVIIRENVVDGRSVNHHPPLSNNKQNTGIWLDHVKNVAIADNVIMRNGRGILLDSSIVTISNNLVVKNGGQAIHLSGGNNLMISTNSLVDNGGQAIFMMDADGIEILGNAIQGNGGGIQLQQARGGTIANNTIVENGRGVFLGAVNRISILNNTIQRNIGDGVVLSYAREVTMVGNALGSGGVRISGDRLAHYQHALAPSNTVNGDPVRYVRDLADITVADPAGQVILVNTTRVQVTGLDLSNTTTGLLMAYTADSTVANNEIRDNRNFGTSVIGGTGHIIANNTIKNNGQKGLIGTAVDAMSIVNNTIISSPDGVELQDSHRTEISGNEITNNGFRGIFLLRGTMINLTMNTVTGNPVGVVVSDLTDVTVTGNAVSNNGDGIYAASLHRVRITFNDINNNSGTGLQAYGGTQSLDVTQNWWGHGSGPSGGVSDACTGATANGTGDRIDTDHPFRQDGEVCFDPWLTDPNPDAGAS